MIDFLVERRDAAVDGPYMGYWVRGETHPTWDPDMPKSLRPAVKAIINNWHLHPEYEPVRLSKCSVWQVRGTVPEECC
ncbi:MAG TPA: hypothetical protein ENH11_00055 [Candidatus Acetothermia bacterium]|nr:hypothetical protein [Candidatus Acetothermia bacterium]